MERVDAHDPDAGALRDRARAFWQAGAGEPALRDAIERECLRRYVALQVDIIYFLPPLLLVTGVVLIQSAPFWAVAAWFLACVGLLVLNQRAYQRVLAGRGLDDLPKVERRLSLQHAAYCAAQASIGLWAVPSGNPSIDMFIIVLLIGSMTATAAVGTLSLSAFAAMAVPFAAGAVAALLSLGGPAFLALSLAILIALGLLSRVALQIGRNARELVSLHAELAQARDEAERASLAKSRFIASMSHELRTPLNAIMGFSEMISTQALGPVGSPRYLEYASDIHMSGRHLLSLINDVLDLAKVEAGKVDIKPEWVDVASIVEGCVRAITPKAKEKALSVERDLRLDVSHFVADERAVRQVLLNILSNAVKFTPAGGRVVVAVDALASGSVLFTISDTGPGIAADQIDRMFEPFEQGENAFAQTSGGTGLGLALVRSLMKLHGGDVRLESRVGEGTHVHLHFPQPERRHEAVSRRA